MQSSATFPFSGGADFASQNAFMQSFNLSAQNLNSQNPMSGIIPNNQMFGGYPMLDQSMQSNIQTPGGFGLNNVNPMLMQQSVGPQLQNIPQNSMASQIPFQVQQQLMAASGNSMMPGYANDGNQFQQMSSFGGMNPAFLAQSFQGNQMSNAMNFALQGLMSGQRNHMGNNDRESYNSNNTVLLGGNQRMHQNNQSSEGTSLRLNTVYVGNLPPNVDHEEIKREFCKVGSIKLNSKSGMPMIWIFKDRGVPRGDALVTYDSNSSASNAVLYFKEHDFSGRRLEVRIATNSERPIIAPPNNQSGATDKRGGNQFRIESISRGHDFNYGQMLDWQRSDNGNSSKFKDFKGGNKQNDKNRGPDWICTKCNNSNFSWRETCNRCQESKGPMPVDVQSQDRGRSFSNSRPNNKSVNRSSSSRSQDGGPMRGSKKSNSRPGPY